MIKLFLFFLSFALCSCSKSKSSIEESPPLVGTWKLLSGQVIAGSDTINTNYTSDQEMIKILNKTHFSFLRHDLKGGKDSSAVFVAGGGTYTVKDGKYIENLLYCNFREWENHTFEFDFQLNDDTLVCTGREKVADIDQTNTEKYVRVE